MVVAFVEKAAAESIEKRQSFCHGEVIIKVHQTIGAAGSGASANHVGDVRQRDASAAVIDPTIAKERNANGKSRQL